MKKYRLVKEVDNLTKDVDYIIERRSIFGFWCRPLMESGLGFVYEYGYTDKKEADMQLKILNKELARTTVEVEPKLYEKKPNILLIMTDDVSVVMMDFLLEKNLMPNLQRYIIDKGTTFTN